MIRKFLFILVSLGVINSVAFAADASSTTAGDIVKGEYLLNSGQYKCRDVASDYRTEIDGYDLLTGTVYCKIYPNSKKVTSDKALAGDAGTRNIAQSYKHWLENDKKASTLKKIENIQNQGLKYAKDALGGYEVTDIEEKDGFKMSDYLTGLAVLKNFDVEKAAGMEATTTETTGFFTKLFGGDDNGGTTTKVTNVAKNLNPKL